MSDTPDSALPGQSLVRPAHRWPGVELFCTTRTGGCGQAPYDSLNLGLGAGDDPRTVLENRARLRRSLPAEPFWLRQVHGCTVADADATVDADVVCDTPGFTSAAGGLLAERRDPDGIPDVPEADAAVTIRRGRVLAVLTADCLPVVLTDVDGLVLGVAHAGWRGLAGGVLEATLSAMRQRVPQARGWRAWIGPGIGPSAFQVGDDVRRAFAGDGCANAIVEIDAASVAGTGNASSETLAFFRADPGAPGKWLADLAGLARWRLSRMGVADIECSGLCTVTDVQRRFFSYRRDGRTGRLATLAWLHD